MILTADRRNEHFDERSAELLKSCDKLARESFRMSTMRLLFFLASLLFLIPYIVAFRFFVLLIPGILCFVTFVFFVIKHIRINNNLTYYKTLQAVHDEYIARTVHAFESLPDDGGDFGSANHDYSADLDLFGHGSLFHLLCTAQTFFGRKKFCDLLVSSSDGLQSPKDVINRQEAASEFSSDLWRMQSFQAEARIHCRKILGPKLFLDHISRPESFGSGIGIVRLIAYGCLTAVMWIAFLISVVLQVNLYPLVFAILIIQLIITAVYYNRNKLVFHSTEGIHRELSGYRYLFEKIENSEVKSLLLSNIRAQMLDHDETRGGKASDQIRKLNTISFMIQIRNQPLLFLLLNTLFLYDVYCLYFLNQWARRSGPALSENLESLGEWEALGCLTMMGVIYPECAFPTFRRAENMNHVAYFSARDMGHPLIPIYRQVRNDFELSKGIALVTGSNMSGKTTLLRTIGINAVLAYAGAVCCAEKLELGMMRIGSSMRISDSLEGGLSSFYAELLRIERIIKRSREETPLLFLIDEIFRGTNSKDRTEGALLVIKNLMRPWVVGLLSTHDYQLCEATRNEKDISFFHFSETYDEDGIHFDYRLSSGVSTSSNARYLMKMVGIE